MRPTARAARIDGLDLLRGIAVGLVLLRHAAPAAPLLLGGRRALVVAGVGTAAACVLTTWWLAEDPDLAYALPTSWALCFVVGAAARVHRDRLAVPPLVVPVALTALAVLSVVPLRGHTLTYLAGGPVIAALTGTLVLAWRTWEDVERPVPPRRALEPATS